MTANLRIARPLMAAKPSPSIAAVSYTHLTLPTKA